MPQPLYSGSPTYVQRLLARETAYDRTQCRLQYDQRVQSLNNEQRPIRSAIDTSQPLTVFIDGPAGAGKTFFYNLILAHTRSEGHFALAVAPSYVLLPYSWKADELLTHGFDYL